MNFAIFSIKTSSFLFIAATLTSCYDAVPDPFIVDETRQKNNFYYLPFSSHSPYTKNKKEVNVKLQYSRSSKHSGIEGQVAFTPTKHLGVTAGIAAGGNTNVMSSPYRIYEGGIGYIVPVNDLLHVETYAGGGMQKINNRHHTGTSSVQNKYVFIQPAAVVHNEKGTVQFAFSSRFVGDQVTVLHTNFTTDREPFVAKQFENMAVQKTHVFWEPGLTFDFGWDQFLFHSGYSYSTDLSKETLFHVKGNFSAGIQLRLGGDKGK